VQEGKDQSPSHLVGGKEESSTISSTRKGNRLLLFPRRGKGDCRRVFLSCRNEEKSACQEKRKWLLISLHSKKDSISSFRPVEKKRGTKFDEFIHLREKKREEGETSLFIRQGGWEEREGLSGLCLTMEKGEVVVSLIILSEGRRGKGIAFAQ